MKIIIHDAGASSAMTGLAVDSFPGIRLFDATDLNVEEGDVLARWQAEDVRDREDLKALESLALAWLGFDAEDYRFRNRGSRQHNEHTVLWLACLAEA